MKIVVGLSGGVDSAVSAALLQREGHEVIGVFIKIWNPAFVACTWQEDRLSAKRVAAHLGIPFHEVDASERYMQLVVSPMIAQYAAGKTPNPDVLCNQYVKFVILSEIADSLGASHIATGHYARIETDDGGVRLLRGHDGAKDQSYFLYRVPSSLLQRTLFPIGTYTKAEVRSLATRLLLPNAARKDSQGVCFIGDISIADFLRRYVTLTSGPVLNEEGETIGEHTGAVQYTVGMRHGFQVYNSLVPHYVIATDTAANTITVAPTPRPAETRTVHIDDVQWVGDVPLGNVQVVPRYRHAPVPAHLERHNDTCIIRADEALIATPGQSLVVYRGDECCGGGVIQ